MNNQDFHIHIIKLFQRRKQTLKETKEYIKHIGLTSNVRSIDDTIGYLIKNNIHIQYRGIL